MSKREILVTPYGEMLDMLACFAIDSGSAEPKKKKMSMEEIFMLK